MSKAYISAARLRQFIANITTAPTATRAEVDYLLAVKDGHVYRLRSDGDSPYLLVTPEDLQWISPTLTAIFNVRSNVSWRVE